MKELLLCRRVNAHRVTKLYGLMHQNQMIEAKTTASSQRQQTRVPKNEKTGVRCLVGKLDPVECERHSELDLVREFNDLGYCETVEVMKEVFGQKFSLFNVRFNGLKLVIEHDEELYDFAMVMDLHYDTFSNRP
ncbi:hypothetical protein ACTXT7_012956 [Hymenolepis weldensis]